MRPVLVSNHCWREVGIFKFVARYWWIPESSYLQIFCLSIGYYTTQDIIKSIHCCYLRALRAYQCAHCFFPQIFRVKFTKVDALTLCFSENLPATGDLAFIVRGQWHYMKCARFSPTDSEGRSNNSVAKYIFSVLTDVSNLAHNY